MIPFIVFYSRFAVELLSKKSEINAKLAQSRDIIQALEKSKSIPSLSVLKQSLNIINNDLQELSVQRDKLSYMDEYRKELDTKRQLTVQMNNLPGANGTFRV